MGSIPTTPIMKKSKKRLEMGEEKWLDYQKQRAIRKAKRYKEKNPERYVNYRCEVKRQLIAYKGGKCEICGYDKDCPSAYDFHHKNPDEKDFALGKRSIGFEKARKEVDKCMLVCRNCHAEIHDEIYQRMKEATMHRLNIGRFTRL